MGLSPHMFDAMERYADGEMSEAESVAFEARLAEDPTLAAEVARLLAELDHLRGALRRVLGSETPPGLRAQIVQALVAEAAADPVGHGSVEPGHDTARRRWFDGPLRANAMAVAASLALVAGAISFGIFGPRITDRPAPGTADTPVTEVAERMSAAHEQCSVHATCGAQDEPWRSREEAQAYLASILHRPVLVPDLADAGFSFCCGGPFCVPGACDRGAQLLYCKVNEDTGQCGWMSVLVVPVETRYLAFDPLGRTGPMQCGVEYSLATPGGEAMHYWCDGVTTWFLRAEGDVDFNALRPLFPAG